MMTKDEYLNKEVIQALQCTIEFLFLAGTAINTELSTFQKCLTPREKGTLILEALCECIRK